MWVWRELSCTVKYIDIAVSFLSIYPRESLKQFPLSVFPAPVFQSPETIYVTPGPPLPPWHSGDTVGVLAFQDCLTNFSRYLKEETKRMISESFLILVKGELLQEVLWHEEDWKMKNYPGPMMGRKLQKNILDPRKIFPWELSLCLFSNNNQHQCQTQRKYKQEGNLPKKQLAHQFCWPTRNGAKPHNLLEEIPKTRYLVNKTLLFTHLRWPTVRWKEPIDTL